MLIERDLCLWGACDEWILLCAWTEVDRKVLANVEDA